MKAVRVIVIIYLSAGTLGFTQDLATIGKQKPVQYSGSLSATTGLYSGHGMQYKRDPYSYVINASLNLRLYNTLDLPFSAYICKNNNSYTQPSFNQFGMSPRYKWVTAHCGYRSMQFSNYTVSGMTFLGGGIEISPSQSPVRISALYGRFSKPTPVTDSAAIQSVTPTYRRMGYGSMITAGDRKNFLSLIFFRASDDISSLPPEAGGTLVTPQENLVTAINGSMQITQYLSTSGEYAFSGYTTDTRMPETNQHPYALGNLYTPNNSSSVSSAMQQSLTYSRSNWSLGISYKRVEPGYQSMGASYMLNDVSDYLINAAKSFYAGRIQVSANSGLQHNNLDHKLSSSERRVVVAMNISYSITEKLTLSGAYSNFSTGREPESISIHDTMHFAQITANRELGADYSFGKEKYLHNIRISGSLQTANTLNETATMVQTMNTTVINGMTGYSLTLTKPQLMLNPALTYNVSRTPNSDEIATTGPSLTAVKWLIKKKMQLSAGISALNSYSGNRLDYTMQIFRTGWNWKITRHHSFRINHALRIRQQTNNKHATENTGTITYQYQL